MLAEPQHFMKTEELIECKRFCLLCWF